MSPPPPGTPPDDTRKGRRRATRQHLAELFADIPPKRRAAFMRRAGDVLTKILEESEPEDTKYDDKGRIARLGTSKRDRAAIVKDALSSFKMLGEISRDATEQRIAVTKLLHGIFNQPQGGRPGAGGGGDGAVPLESLLSLKATVEHNECPPTPSLTQPSPVLQETKPETAQSSSAGAFPISNDSQD